MTIPQRVIALIWAGVLVTGGAVAQSNLATVTGVVTDSAGGAIPGVALTVVNSDTGIDRNVTSDDAGQYTVTNLAPGTYEVRATHQGFRVWKTSGLVLQVGQQARVDVALEVGSVTESVTVNASQVTVNTENGTIKGDVIVQAEIQELPLDGRDFTDLAFFVPGVVPRAQGGQGSALNINGARASNTNFYVDGFNNRNARGAAAQVRPNIDAMQEFKMEVSGYSAEYGKFAGGILNMVLKSGTNQTHGTLFHYIRNDKFDARGFFEGDKNKLRRNQFGATVNGPIFRNKTFYLASFEGYTQILENTRLGRTIPDLERAGDFTQSLNFSNARLFLRDPLAAGTCTASSAGGCFPGNVIPQSRIDPVARKLLEYFPRPNRAGANNYTVTAADEDKWYSILAKVDHRFSERDNVAFRYQKRFDRGASPFSGSDLGTFGFDTKNDRSLAGADWTHMFTPSFLMEFRAGFSRSSEVQSPVFGGKDMNAELGLPSPGSDETIWAFPRITVLNHFSLGNAAEQPVQFFVTDIQYNQKATWIKKAHTLKFGYDYSRVRFNQPFYNNQRGTYAFQGRWTNSIVGDVLLGLLNNTSRQVGFNRNYYRQTFHGFFFNDDWKVSRTLTLNLGVRYELNMPFYDRYDRLGNFVPGLNKLVISDPRTVPNLAELVATAGLADRIATRQEAGLNRGLTFADYTNFAPRVGIAWRPFGMDGTVVRTGYGIFYAGELLNPIRNDLSNNFPYAVNQTFARLTSDPNLLTLAQPFPTSRTALAGANTAFGYDTHAPTGYLQSWNFTVERELFKTQAVEIGYVGSKGSHLARRYDYNQNFRSLELYNQVGTAFPRPIPGFQAINYYSFGTNSNYNAFQVSLRRRGSSAFFYRFNYTYGKSIDDASQVTGNADGGFPNANDSRNLKLERGRSDFDIGHGVSAVVSYELPFGRARRFLSGMRGVKQGVLGGWQLSGTSRASTGQPFTVRTSDVDLNLGESQRPNRVAKGTLSGGARPGQQGVDYAWFDLDAFEEAPCVAGNTSTTCGEGSKYGFQPFSVGNSGRNILDGPGLFIVDVGMRKNFRYEKKSAQLRLDCFNVLNYTNFLLPNNLFNAIGGGLITEVGGSGRNGGPRVFQAALTVRF
ncbi:MAG: TonB-dependent receptor [Acidobacteria bacterium]|nr:TonB-dependent receptor [Acidobacteriota bacterium]